VTVTAMPLPESVRISPNMSLTPNEMRLLKEKTGRALNDLIGGDIDDMDAAPDRIQSLVWVQLRRDGWELEWEQAGDVRPEFGEVVPDPTNAGPSPGSSGSAGSGT